MANTFTQIHIQAVFAVQNRISLIRKEWRQRLYSYITAIIQNHGHKVLSIGGTDDHVHIFFGFRPTQSLADLMQQVKRDSSEWINQNNFVLGRFAWQEGYGAFSYGKSQISDVASYIERQESHHATQKFVDEYEKLLIKFGVDYDKKYIFHTVDETHPQPPQPYRACIPNGMLGK